MPHRETCVAWLGNIQAMHGYLVFSHPHTFGVTMTTEQQDLADGETICLANLHLATAQQVFDQVVRHLLTQGEAAIDPVEGDCRYRAELVRDEQPVTLKCAAGCLIADNEYSPRMEGNSWEMLCDRALVPVRHGELIFWLQSVHDYATAPAVWCDKLVLLAYDLGLSADVIHEYTKENKPNDN